MAVMERNGNLAIQLARLARLQGELALGELRGALIAAAATVAVGVVAVMALVSALVLLLAGVLSPLFGGRWEPLVIAGGGVAIAAVGAMAWSVWSLRRLEMPREALTSLMENWEWLVGQVKSRLTWP